MLAQSFGRTRHLVIVLLFSSLISASPDYPNELNAYLETHPIQTVSGQVTKFGNTLPNLPRLNAVRNACPISCEESRLDSTEWTVFHDVKRLSFCNQTMLLDFTVHNPLDYPRTRSTIRSCTVRSKSGASSERIANRDDKPGKRSPVQSASQTQVNETFQMASAGRERASSLSDFSRASRQLVNSLSQQGPRSKQSIKFAYSSSVVVGLFAGSAFRSQDLTEPVLEQFITSVEASGLSETVFAQLCGDDRSSRYSMGVIANANADVAFVQKAVATWASGECVTYIDTKPRETITLSMLASSTSTDADFNDAGLAADRTAPALAPRTTNCRAIEVENGDTCSSLANECGITPAQFTEYNPEPNECSTLTAGEHVCCSNGTLPDYSPNPYSNGTCYTYLVQSGDSCSSIAAAYSLTITQLENFNNNTWGWDGCSDLQAAQNLCLSSGYPPMPSVVQNAVCGPQVPGTPVAAQGTNYSTLNECPLNACCDIWGQCGTTSEFCTESQSATGAPGTAAPGQNGCISNCGTQIVTGSAPSSQYTVGYFEGFNVQRPCLNQPIQDVDLSSYTHVHLSFGEITSNYDVSISSIQQQFDSFLNLDGGFKKIVSIGGWAFCTDPSTYNLYREAVTSANRDTFAANIVSFLNEYELDGIDFDWEYPGEPDIPGIPAGSSSDGPNYLAFLEVLAGQMPSGKTISFTAPASFWYLKAFPVANMSKSADYVVFMTYDLHGQWDYGNKWSDPGCTGGDCLRSDVNLTETISALSMVTKAGVPANMIAVGVTSYGRSFQMTTSGCYTEECTYTGPNSGAYAGLCTDTNGYISNAEIGSIIDGNATVYNLQGAEVSITGTPYTYLDNNSYSNIVVYDSTQWIGYMDDSNKASRASMYQGYNFLGTADWAIDLASYDGDGGAGASGSSIVDIPPSIWSSPNPSITCDPPCIFVLPPYPLGFTTTITWPTLTTTLLSSSGNAILTVTTTISVPAFLISSLSLQPVTLLPTQTETYEINPVQSITPSSFVFTLGPNEATFPPVQIPTSGASVGGPVPGNSAPSPNTSDSSSSSSTAAAVIPAGVTFHTTPFPITIQPQPTYSISFPPKSTPVPAVTVSTGPPPASCTSGCGSRNCGIFGCGPGCGLFACNGGCGIFGCGGGCGVFGCEAGCALDACGGLDCTVPGSCGGNEGGGDGTNPGGNPDEPEDSCDNPVTVSACTYYVSSYTQAKATTYITTTTTSCTTTTTCDGEDSKTTETINACQSTIGAGIPSGASKLGTMVSGTYVPYVYLPTLTSPTPTGTIVGAGFSSTTTSCNACTYLAGIEFACSAVAGCTKTTTRSSTSTMSKTSTVTANPAPTASAQCAYWINSILIASWYNFEVYNIEGSWPGTGGASLHHQEDGCGDLTSWHWHNAGKYLASASFNLPLLIKAGCVERAIATAKGPLLKCEFMGYSGGSFSKRDDYVAQGAVKLEQIESHLSYTSHSEYNEDEDVDVGADYESYARRERRGQRKQFAEFRRKRQATSSSSIGASSAASPLTNSASLARATSAPTYSYSTSFTAPPLYTAETWNTNITTPVTFTWTYNSYSVIYITTTTVIASASSVPVPMSVPASSTPVSTSTTSTTSPPAPTQSGTAANCDQYYVVKSGDSCSAVESNFNITFSQFYAWNPSIGSNCQYLDVGDAYCVGVPGSSTMSSTISPPAPTQSGTAANCDQYYVVKSGDSCSAIESEYNITFQQFYNWNPSIGSNCQYLDVGDAYCVAVS